MVTKLTLCRFSQGSTTFTQNPLESATFYYGDKPKIFQKKPQGDEPISQEDYHKRVQHPKGSEKGQLAEFSFFYPFEELRDIELVDTPGFDNKQNEHDTDVTLEATKKADVVLFLLDANTGEISQSVLGTLRNIKSSSNAIWYAFINKADSKPSSSIQKIKEKIEQQHKDFFSDVQPYSAKKVLEQQEKSKEKIIQCVSDLLASTMRHLTQQVSQLNADEASTSIQIDVKHQKDRTHFEITQPRKPPQLLELYQPKQESSASRARIIEVLRIVGEQKQTIARERFEEERTRYKAKFSNQIQHIQSKRAKLSSRQPADMTLRMKRIDALFSNIQRDYAETVKHFPDRILKESFTIRPIPKEKKEYWFDPYYELGLFKSDYDQVWQQHAYIWAQLKDSMMEIKVALQEDLQISMEKKTGHITNKLDTMRSEIKQGIFGLLKSVRSNKILDSYDSEKEAKNALNSYIIPHRTKIQMLLLDPVKEFCSQLKQEISHQVGALKENVSHQQQRWEDLSRKIDDHLQKRKTRDI